MRALRHQDIEVREGGGVTAHVMMGGEMSLQGQRIMPPRPFVRLISGDFALFAHPARDPWGGTVYGQPLAGVGIPVDDPRTECLTRLDVWPRPRTCVCGAVDLLWGESA